MGGGQGVRGMCLNRALAFVLKRFWQVIAKGDDWIYIDAVLATEIVMAIAVLPLAYCDLRLRTDSVVSATDAEPHGPGLSEGPDHAPPLSKPGLPGPPGPPPW